MGRTTKPMFFDPAHRLPLACFEASRAWFLQEKACTETIQRTGQLSDGEFETFLKVWGVARTALTTRRLELAERLAKIAEDYQEPNDILSKTFVADVEKLYDDKLTTGRPYSLVSKYLFCKNPSRFSPYDKHASRGLCMASVRGGTVDYASFLEAFEEFHAELSGCLERRSLTYDLFAYNGNTFENEQQFSRRVADKYLMLLGGFGEHRMARYVNDQADQFPSETVTRFS